MSSRDVGELLEELIKISEQNERWLRFLAWGDVRRAIQDQLDEPWEYHAFEMLDGEVSARQMAGELPTSDSSINRRCKRWRTAGIAIQLDNGKYDKIVSLEALNIDIPELEENDD